MRLFVRATLAASLLAACHTVPPALPPSPAARPPASVSAAPTTTAAPRLTPRFARAEAPRLADTRASLPGKTERANGTRTLLIVVAVAAVAVAAIVLFGTNTDAVY